MRRAVRFQGFDRGCGHIQRRRMLFHGRERFTEPGSESTNDFTQGIQNVFSPRRLDLLLRENAAGVAVLGAQAQHILGSKAGDRAFQDCGAGGPLTHLLRDLRGQPRIFRLSHQRQCLMYLLIRNQAEERGLLKLDGQPLPQRVVKHRIACLILKLREDDGVLVGQARGTVKIDVACNRERQRQCRSSWKNHFPAFRTGGGAE